MKLNNWYKQSQFIGTKTPDFMTRDDFEFFSEYGYYPSDLKASRIQSVIISVLSNSDEVTMESLVAKFPPNERKIVQGVLRYMMDSGKVE